MDRVGAGGGPDGRLGVGRVGGVRVGVVEL